MSIRSVALIGLSGAGKSTVACLLAGRLGWPWADTDPLIEQNAGASIPDIFARQGEQAFRDLESAALRQALTQDARPLVLATGGGVVLREQNRQLLHAQAYVVWLDAPVAQLVARLTRHQEARPLLAGDAAARLEALRSAREALYCQLANLRVDTSELAPAQVAEHILQQLAL
jgi:shikimate kinase